MRPTHSRKARWPGDCPLCRGPIRIGERVARVGKRGTWMHLKCFRDRYQQPAGG